MRERLAVVDLGTNTFHLLIVEKNNADNSWQEIYRERKYVYLAEEGIQIIGAAAFQRGLDTLASYTKACQKFAIQKAKAFGTAALRNATNGAEFVEQARALFPYDIEIIDGLKEANLIAAGVGLAIPPTSHKQLIMDIGGGSVEFILTAQNQVLWAQSFTIGVAVLFKKFHHSDPISNSDTEKLMSFLSTTLLPLREQLEQHETPDLIGASGTFDVLENLIEKMEKGKSYAELRLSDYSSLYEKMLSTTLAERKEMPNLPVERAELIIVALALIQYVLSIHPFQKLLVSKYAMKEGMLYNLQ